MSVHNAQFDVKTLVDHVLGLEHMADVMEKSRRDAVDTWAGKPIKDELKKVYTRIVDYCGKLIALQDLDWAKEKQLAALTAIDNLEAPCLTSKTRNS